MSNIYQIYGGFAACFFTVMKKSFLNRYQLFVRKKIPEEGEEKKQQISKLFAKEDD